jgi:hypothetical protein
MYVFLRGSRIDVEVDGTRTCGRGGHTTRHRPAVWLCRLVARGAGRWLASRPVGRAAGAPPRPRDATNLTEAPVRTRIKVMYKVHGTVQGARRYTFVYSCNS